MLFQITMKHTYSLRQLGLMCYCVYTVILYML